MPESKDRWVSGMERRGEAEVEDWRREEEALMSHLRWHL